jgi:hypothetical protein
VVKRIDLTTNLPAGRQGITKENSKPARLTPVGRVTQRENVTKMVDPIVNQIFIYE